MEFFEVVRDAFEGFVAGVGGRRNVYVHGRGLKVWFDDDTREHYESQLIRVDGQVKLEIGFHAEYPKAPHNDEVLQRLLAVDANQLRLVVLAGVVIEPDLHPAAVHVDVAPTVNTGDEALEGVAHHLEERWLHRPHATPKLGTTGWFVQPHRVAVLGAAQVPKMPISRPGGLHGWENGTGGTEIAPNLSTAKGTRLGTVLREDRAEEGDLFA
jgi:hypothetical protein